MTPAQFAQQLAAYQQQLAIQIPDQVDHMLRSQAAVGAPPDVSVTVLQTPSGAQAQANGPGAAGFMHRLAASMADDIPRMVAQLVRR